MEQSKNAVIVRGQARTWPYIAKNNIETLEELNTLHEGLKKVYFS